MIETRYRSLKTIHRTGVAVLHCPGCVLTSNLRCLDIFTSTRLWLLPITGVANNLCSSSLLSSFAGGETCNWRWFTVNWTTLHTTGLADMAPATPSHGTGLQLSPCANAHVENTWLCFGSLYFDQVTNQWAWFWHTHFGFWLKFGVGQQYEVRNRVHILVVLWKITHKNQ